MRCELAIISTALLATVGALAQQQPAGQQSTAQQPKPHSNKEIQALQKVQADQQAQNWAQEIQDINSVLENFADTEFKNMLLNMAMDAAQKQGDYATMVSFGQQIVATDPKDVTARVTLAESMAQHARDTDLNKADEIKQIDDYANKALEILKTNPSPPPGVAPDQWPQFEKQLEGQAHDALGLAAQVDKKYTDAINEFKLAYTAVPSPVILTHEAKAYLDNKQYDDAIAADDKVLADASATPQVKQFAQQQKDAATKMKGTK